MQSRGHRAALDAEGHGDLFVVEVRVVAQEQNCSLSFGETGDRDTNLGPLVGDGHGSLHRACEWHDRAALLTEAHIRQDPPDPRFEAALAAEPGEIRDCANECVVHGVPGLLGVAEYGRRDAEEARIPRLIESFQVDVGKPHARHLPSDARVRRFVYQAEAPTTILVVPFGLRPRLSPGVAVAVIALLSFVVCAALGYAASVPRFFMDELYYMKAGVSVGQGHGLQFEGRSWGYGPILPLLIGGLVRLTGSQETTYTLVKVANAAFFALTLVPIYLVSRRLLRPWPSVAVVALAALIPSSMYTSVSMTESLGYLVAWWSIYAILRALERPGVERQLVAIGAVALAIAARPQFVSLFGGYLLGLAVVIAMTPGRRPSAASLWPTALAIVGGLGWIARPLVQGHGVGRSLGSYSSLAQSYDPLLIGKWFVYHVGDLALYLGVVPLVVAPIVVVLWWRRARTGSEIDAAFLALFVSQNVVGIGLIAAFASTSAGLGILYDRYLFYLVPLWLLVFVAWLREGMPKPIKPLAVGVTGAVVAVGTLPFTVVGRQSWFQHFEAVATGVWGKAAVVVAKVPLVSLRLAGVVFAVAMVGAVVRASRRQGWILVALVAAVLSANMALSWRSAFVPQAAYGIGPRGTRTWLDDAVGARANVTVLVVGRACALAGVQRFSALETDYFNRSVRRVVYLGGEGGGNPTALTVLSDGRLAKRSGAALDAAYVVAPPGVDLVGSRLATGMPTGLVLWRTGGAMRARSARSDKALLATACRSM